MSLWELMIRMEMTLKTLTLNSMKKKRKKTYPQAKMMLVLMTRFRMVVATLERMKVQGLSKMNFLMREQHLRRWREKRGIDSAKR